jgi:PQQ-dependent dehydrogenase (methanol/ethanol family)
MVSSWSQLATSAEPADINTARLLAADKEPANWITVGGTSDETHYSPLERINTSNVSKLGLAWYGDFTSNRGQEATSIVVDGVLYTSGSWSKVYAYDGATGRELWNFDPQIPGAWAKNACCDVVNRGVAVWKGKVFVGALDGRLIALDAKTGKPVWSTLTVDPKKPYTITGAPRVANGKVIIGNSGSEYGVRGYVTAYDARTGKQVWRFFVTPNPENKPDGAASDNVLMAKAFSTWGEGSWKQTGGGGTVWDAIVFDREFNQIIFGTGNGTPWSWKSRSGNKGDNLFLSSLVAVDADSGAYKWHYQETPSDDWDYDSGQGIVLAQLPLNGQTRKVVLHAPKNGFFYVLDRRDGALISAEKFATMNWASGIDRATGRPVIYPQARYGVSGGDFLGVPGPFGAHSWHPMSYSPKTQLVYIPSQNSPFGFADDGTFQYHPGLGNWNLAMTSSQNGGPRDEPERKLLGMRAEGSLLAWDPVRQKEAWRVNFGTIASAGTLVTGGNLVFQGTPDGRLVAYSADKGEKLWSWQGFDGIGAGPMSYLAGGEQYVAVLAGPGGSITMHVPYFKNPRVGTNGRVLVFKLNGKTLLPDNSKPIQPPAITNEQWPADVVAKGEKLYGNCVFCHGFGLSTNNMMPDLRRSPAVPEKRLWDAIVLQGAREPLGMPNWGGKLTADDSEALRAFVATRARVLRQDEDIAARASAKTN